MSGWSVANVFVTDDTRIDEEELDDSLSYSVKDNRISLMGHGYGSESRLRDELKTILKSGAVGKKDDLEENVIGLVGVLANDTTDSGNAGVFDLEVNHGNIVLEEIEEFAGAEGANARDVASNIKEDYGIYPRVR